MIKKSKLILLVILLAFGVFFFLGTNPSEVPIYVLIVPFIYFFTLFYLLTSQIQDLLNNKMGPSIPLIVSSLILLMIILGSLHQLSAKDIILSLVLMLLLGWYIRKLENK